MSDGTKTPVIEADALTKAFSGRAAVDRVSFSVAAGEVVALLGPNGAGKSTLIGCLLGFLLPSAGQIRVFGQIAAEMAPALRGRTGFVPQALTGFTSFRVGELIDYLGTFYDRAPPALPAGLLDWAALEMKARVKSLSGGQKQQLAILLALRHEPDLLILDEPVASLDTQARRDFMGLLRSYCAAEGRTALISSHILSDLEKVATRALFMRRGELVHDTPMQRFFGSTRWVEAPGLEAAVLREGGWGRARAPETGALLVDGWDEDAAGAVRQRLGAEVAARAPDLETAFLEITR
jgi:ABC-2 type transport system ATP-binding protein